MSDSRTPEQRMTDWIEREVVKAPLHPTQQQLTRLAQILRTPKVPAAQVGAR
jgi:hypothetical protein